MEHFNWNTVDIGKANDGREILASSKIAMFCIYTHVYTYILYTYIPLDTHLAKLFIFATAAGFCHANTHLTG